ncbi:MAG: (2Fe-2S)-binding protein [Eubacteriales bacterium]|nr:(2Fe-2S)-binding protein [Eubacteriales bacterium]
MGEKISFVLNGANVSLETEPMRRLLDVLREDFGLTGSKEGCGEGECGACAVLVDGRLINSCLMPVLAVQGKRVVTIEGFRETARFHALSGSFDRAGAVQCGFCTPGMLLAAEALLTDNPDPTEEDIRGALSGNLCRCTGYTAIVEAIRNAAREGEGLWP